MLSSPSKLAIAVAFGLTAVTFGLTAVATTGRAQPPRALRVGDKVEVKWSGTWYPATVLAASGGGYKIHYDGWSSSYDEVVEPVRIRTPQGVVTANTATTTTTSTTTTTTTTRAGAASVAPGRYNCVFYVGGQGLVNGGGFTIAAGGHYTDRAGKVGTYTFDAAAQLLTFHGAAYDGQRAEYGSAGRPTLHVLGPSGRRVMDCDGP